MIYFIVKGGEIVESKNLSEKIKSVRKAHNLTQIQLAQAAEIAVNSLRLYESGKLSPKFETLQKLAAALGVSVNDLLDSAETTAAPTIPPGFEPLPDLVSVPLVGSIACGTPILAEQNIEKHVSVPEKWHADFVLTCHGDSMAPHIKDGDLVAIRKQPEVESGEIAAVRIGEEATLKRFYRQGDAVLLQADNVNFPPLIYSNEQLNQIVIEGVAVGLCRDL